MCKRSTKIEKSSALGRKRQNPAPFWGGSASRAAVLGRVLGRFWDRFYQNVRHASHHRLKTGSADPNAPSGASTAAPVFEDWRLLQLSAFCSLQYLDRSLVICSFLALDVCIFLQLFACS